MDFELHIRNIGKLTDANIRIGRFTVFAGPNNTGKSTVSKLLYSLFDAMNTSNAEVYIQNLLHPIRARLNFLMRRRLLRKDDDLYSLSTEIINLPNLFKAFTIEDIGALDKLISNLVVKVKTIQEKVPRTREYIESEEMQQQDSPVASDSIEYRSRKETKQIFSEIEFELEKLYETLSNTNAEEFINSGIEYEIEENLIENFQVPNLADLKHSEDARSEVNIEGLGKFAFENGNTKLDIDRGGLWKLQQCSNVIYLESPVYWKLKNALENFRISPRYRPRIRRPLSGIPGYFYDLSVALRQKYTGDITFPDLYKKLTSKDILGGKIAISESGDLLFRENGHKFSLSMTAMGVANLGILALLIERKVLNEDTLLFIDEPEAHLHPAWQVIMVEALFELAKGGVNVVIATHSADILKWLEVHVKKNPEYKSMIALNKFPADSSGSEEQDFEDQIASIKQELTKPFADLYTAGL